MQIIYVLNSFITDYNLGHYAYYDIYEQFLYKVPWTTKNIQDTDKYKRENLQQIFYRLSVRNINTKPFIYIINFSSTLRHVLDIQIQLQ